MFIHFFYSGWIDENHINYYHQHKDSLLKSCKTILFKEACQDIEDFIAKGEVS